MTPQDIVAPDKWQSNITLIGLVLHGLVDRFTLPTTGQRYEVVAEHEVGGVRFIYMVTPCGTCGAPEIFARSAEQLRIHRWLPRYCAACKEACAWTPAPLDVEVAMTAEEIGSVMAVVLAVHKEQPHLIDYELCHVAGDRLPGGKAKQGYKRAKRALASLRARGLVAGFTEDERFVLGVLDQLPPGEISYTVEALTAAVVERAPPPPRDADGVDLERDTRYFRYGFAIDGLIKKRVRVRRQGGMLVVS